jgi:hypothetical protein
MQELFLIHQYEDTEFKSENVGYTQKQVESSDFTKLL